MNTKQRIKRDREIEIEKDMKIEVDKAREGNRVQWETS